MTNIPIETQEEKPTQIQIERDIALIKMAGIAYNVPVSVGPCYPYMVKVDWIGRWYVHKNPLTAVDYVRSMGC